MEKQKLTEIKNLTATQFAVAKITKNLNSEKQ